MEIDIHTNQQIHRKDEDLSPGSRKEEEDKEEEQVGFCSLFRFATCFDYFLIVIGTIGAAVTGVAMPAFVLLWGDITQEFGSDPAVVEGLVKDLMLIFIYIGLGAFIAGWIMYSSWMITGERQSIACRKAYLRCLLKQEIGWFDLINQSELASTFATDCFAFQGAIGEKVSNIIMSIAMFIAGFVIAFMNGWVMSLVMLGSLPFLALGGIAFAVATSKKN